jgi:hypothetical protein
VVKFSSKITPAQTRILDKRSNINGSWLIANATLLRNGRFITWTSMQKTRQMDDKLPTG